MFSNLPQDIGRIIFELAAEAGDGLRCAFVSKQVQSWVEPVIYRSVCLSGYMDVLLLHRTMTDPKTSKTPEFLVQHVKFVSVATRDPEAKLIEILKACRGVRVLANWVFYLDSRAMRELFSSSDLSPTRLCVSAEATEDVFFQVSQGPEPCLMDLSLPIFQNLTHLELICASEDGWKYWDGLSLLSNLTHLSVDHGYFHSQAYIEVARKILFQCPASLRVFVFWVPSRSLIRGGWKEVYAINKGNVDPRAVVASTGGFIKDDPFGHPEYALCRSHPDTERDWKGKTTGKDFWELAEEIIERRRKWLQERQSVTTI